MLWLWPATIQGPLHEGALPATLDLGCRLALPTTLTVAGLGRRKSRLADGFTQAVTEGAQLHVLAERASLTTRAHLIGADGRNVISALQGRAVAPPLHDFGQQPDGTWRYPGIIRKVIDADTIAIDLDTGSPVRWTVHTRIAHVNAAEHGTTEGDAATVWARNVLPEGAETVLTSTKLEKYGRLLGQVALPDGSDYATALLTAGHAVAYEGGPRPAAPA